MEEVKQVPQDIKSKSDASEKYVRPSWDGYFLKYEETKLTQDLDAEKYLVKTEWGPLKLIPLIKEKMK